ncbi:hypothetical protein HHI36_011868 [Cryptolaemus montrouzieri]|uniref:Mitochondrial ATPase inhibitor n=1 Tax=Cryptolaemus montrouzieri TaxID=559131 RepID=A0ABD2NCW0_9CUCU
MLSSRLTFRRIPLRLMSQVRDTPGDLPDQGKIPEQPSQQATAYSAEAVDEQKHYFDKEQKKQMEVLKENLLEEISFHEEQIRKHQEAVAYYKKEVAEIKA